VRCGEFQDCYATLLLCRDHEHQDLNIATSLLRLCLKTLQSKRSGQP
jgi:hypothetical protein